MLWCWKGYGHIKYQAMRDNRHGVQCILLLGNSKQKCTIVQHFSHKAAISQCLTWMKLCFRLMNINFCIPISNKILMLLYCELLWSSRSLNCKNVGINITTVQNFFVMVQQSLMGQGLLIIEASQSHSDTPHSVRILDEWSVQHRDLYLITQQTKPCLPVGFKPAIPACEQPQTHALDHIATRIGTVQKYFTKCRLYILTFTNTHILMSEVCTLVKCMCDANYYPQSLGVHLYWPQKLLYASRSIILVKLKKKKWGDSSLWLPPSKM
jgi:hypothetical protein